jgi:hypothetical protein
MAVNVSPVPNARGVLPNASLQWKAPRDPNNVTAADPRTRSFVVYCDPNLVRLKTSTYNHHIGVPYFADQLLDGNISADPIQKYTRLHFWLSTRPITGAWIRGQAVGLNPTTLLLVRYGHLIQIKNRKMSWLTRILLSLVKHMQDGCYHR